jgi:hypothetical protein
LRCSVEDVEFTDLDADDIMDLIVTRTESDSPMAVIVVAHGEPKAVGG